MSHASPQELSRVVITRLTPPGVAAIAVIGVYGPQALPLVNTHFRRHTSKPQPDPALLSSDLTSIDAQPKAILGWWEDGLQRDEVILVLRKGRDYPLIEIHCHGGPAVLDWIVSTLRTRGAKEVVAEDWLRLTESNSVKRAILARLPQAPTYRTTAILLDQLNGAWNRCLEELQHLLSVRSPQARSLVERLCSLIPAGEHLCRPFQVALAGAPNTGKSTLLNTLLGYTRAITSPQPGTTRDIVTADTAFAGWPIRLLDTAGWRSIEDPLESAGIARAVQTWSQADLVLWLLDASAPPVFPPLQLQHSLLVINKTDLPLAWQIEQMIRPSMPYLLISAKTGAGIQQLIHAIVNYLVPVTPQPGEAVPFTTTLCQSLRNLRCALQANDWDSAESFLISLQNPNDQAK